MLLRKIRKKAKRDGKKDRIYLKLVLKKSKKRCFIVGQEFLLSLMRQEGAINYLNFKITE